MKGHTERLVCHFLTVAARRKASGGWLQILAILCGFDHNLSLTFLFVKWRMRVTTSRMHVYELI